MQQYVADAARSLRKSGNHLQFLRIPVINQPRFSASGHNSAAAAAAAVTPSHVLPDGSYYSCFRGQLSTRVECQANLVRNMMKMCYVVIVCNKCLNDQKQQKVAEGCHEGDPLAL